MDSVALYGRLWQRLTWQFQTNTLPHALLFAGSQGLGKRDLVWQFVAWALCPYHHKTACGNCDSCRLVSHAHPSIQRLPKDSDGTVSVDDVRALLSFVYQAANTRFVVMDHAEALSTAAANALLKMLEEPSEGVFFILISDRPARLLPTIKSRVQRVALTPKPNDQCPSSDMLLALADFAPVRAANLPNEAWFGKRADWLKSFWLLQTKKRTTTQAVAFWQEALALADFLTLCHYMLAEVWRFKLGLPLLHTDLDDTKLLGDLTLEAWQLTAMMNGVFEVEKALKQNVQERLGYEKLLTVLGGF